MCQGLTVLTPRLARQLLAQGLAGSLNMRHQHPSSRFGQSVLYSILSLLLDSSYIPLAFVYSRNSCPHDAAFSSFSLRAFWIFCTDLNVFTQNFCMRSAACWDGSVKKFCFWEAMHRAFRHPSLSHDQAIDPRGNSRSGRPLRELSAQSRFISGWSLGFPVICVLYKGNFRKSRSMRNVPGGILWDVERWTFTQSYLDML